MSKWNELKSWAEAVIGLNKTNQWDWVASVEDGRLGKTHTLFALAANPAAILELITENERNERMLLAACVDMGAIGEALGADMNSDGEELLSMVVDMKAENERLREFLLHISRTSGDKGAVLGACELLKEFGA